jgi:hypothetical protein
MRSSYAVTDFEVNGRKTIKFFEMKVQISGRGRNFLGHDDCVTWEPADT